MKRTKVNDRRYGGADRICEVRAEKDMLLIMVGKKTGREANETLIERKINACNHGTRLDRVLIVAEALIRDRKLALSTDIFSPWCDASSC